MHHWGDEFTDEIGEFLADDPPAAASDTKRKGRAATSSRRAAAVRASRGDLFSLLAIPWTDHETAEFLHLVGIDERRR